MGAVTTLNTAFGTFASLSEESLVTFTKLTKQAGLSEEAAVALTKTALLNNKTVEDNQLISKLKKAGIKHDLMDIDENDDVKQKPTSR